MMPKRKSKRDSHGEPVEKREGEGVRYRSRTVMGLLKTKLRRNKSGSGLEEGEELSVKQKCATLPARVVSGDGGSVGKGGGSGRNGEGNKTRTLYWMEEYLGPYEDSLKQSLVVSRKDSNESVDSGFEQTHKTEGSETDSNSSPAQSKALIPVGALFHEASGSFQEEPRYQSVQSNSMYDEAAFDKAFGPMKDIGRWYSTYSSHKQLQQMRLETSDRGRGHDLNDEVCGAEMPSRPVARCVLEEHEQRLVSRPLPPIPYDPAGEEEEDGGKQDAAVGGASQQQQQQQKVQKQQQRDSAVAAECSSHGVGNRTHEDMYELVEHRLRGNNPLMLGLRNVARYGWYWGPVTRVEAEEKLQGTDNGTFLVRDSSDERYLLSLSFRSQGKTLHTRIEYSNGFFSFYSFPDSDSEGYRSVVELIEWSMKHSRDGIFCFSRGKAIGSPAVPVRLLKPLSRFNQVRTLQHYCRFVIRQSIRFDCIRQLPLPRHVHGFLEQSQY